MEWWQDILHRAGIEKADDVRIVCLDPNGTLSVLKRET